MGSVMSAHFSWRYLRACSFRAIVLIMDLVIALRAWALWPATSSHDHVRQTPVGGTYWYVPGSRAGADHTSRSGPTRREWRPSLLQ